MPAARWVKVSAVAAVIILAATGVAWRLMQVGIVESYSRSWHSNTSRESERRGFLVARLITDPPQIRCKGVVFDITDAWIEPRTHVEYPFYLFRREVRDTGYYLIVTNAARDTTNAWACG